MDISLTTRANEYELRLGSVCVKNISKNDLIVLEKKINAEIYFREDVENYIERHKIIIHEDTFAQILEAYASLIPETPDLDLMQEECLNEAFEGFEYGDELTSEMEDKFIKALLSNISGDDDFEGTFEVIIVGRLNDNQMKQGLYEKFIRTPEKDRYEFVQRVIRSMSASTQVAMYREAADYFKDLNNIG